MPNIPFPFKLPSPDIRGAATSFAENAHKNVANVIEQIPFKLPSPDIWGAATSFAGNAHKNVTHALIEQIRAKLPHRDNQNWKDTPGDYEVHWVHNPCDGTALCAWMRRVHEARGTVFFAHGFTRCAADMLEYGRKAEQKYHMCSMGWDARMHGSSGNGILSFGINESYDLEAVINKAEAEGLPRPYILYGISLGGMTSRIAARRLPQVDGAIIVQAPANPHIAIEKTPTHPGVPEYVPSFLKQGLVPTLLKQLINSLDGFNNCLDRGIPDDSHCPMHPHADPMILEIIGERDYYGCREMCDAFEAWPEPRGYRVNPLSDEGRAKRRFRLLLPIDHPGTNSPWFGEFPQYHEYLDAFIQRVVEDYEHKLQDKHPSVGSALWKRGDLYYSRRDYEKAFGFYKESADAQQEWGYFNVAKCYDYGHGVPLSKAKALEFYRKAADMGNYWAGQYGGWLQAHMTYVRMSDGEPFCRNAADLEELRTACRDILAAFNSGDEQRLYSHIHAANAYIATPFSCEYGCNIYVAQGSYINMDCYFDDSAPISIGENVLVGPRVKILTTLSGSAAQQGSAQAAPVHIGRKSWICGGAVICAGVTIGEGSVVAAGAVVTENVPPYTLVAGNPAKVKRELH